MLIQRLSGFLGRLRFPYLFAVTAALFVLNLIIPDPLPFLDELLLGLGAALLASYKERNEQPSED